MKIIRHFHVGSGLDISRLLDSVKGLKQSSQGFEKVSRYV